MIFGPNNLTILVPLFLAIFTSVTPVCGDTDQRIFSITNNDMPLQDPPVVSWTEFTNAFTWNGYQAPSLTKYRRFNRRSPRIGKVSSKMEMAMLLAQLLHESQGLTLVSEIGCPDEPQCKQYQYPNWNPQACGPTLDQNCRQYPASDTALYYGRGYMQLSWPVNYEAASWYLYGNDTLYTSPDLVSRINRMSWDTALWFWKAAVRTDPRVLEGQFGAATMAINGWLECQGSGIHIAKRRFQIYQRVFAAFNLRGSPDERGCYN